MAERDRLHLVVPGAPASEPFTLSSSGGGTDPKVFGGDRGQHGRRLKKELEEALESDVNEDEPGGSYITFVSFPGLEMALESLDSQARGEQPELVAVSEEMTDDGLVQMATVYIPDGKKEYFIRRLTKYVETVTDDKAKHAALVEGIQSIRRATIKELWTDPIDQFPAEDGLSHWWEVWLLRRDGGELGRFTNFVNEHELRTSNHYLGFGDRTVLLLLATAEQLAETFNSLDDIAELRRPHDVANFLPSLEASEQAEWVEELRQRLQVAALDAPTVCVIDTGVQNGHPLLSDSLAPNDVHVADPGWQARPSGGHGTEMAGLALYGDLHSAVLSAQTVRLRHRLESVKFLPDNKGNDPDLYGAITARSVDRPEIEAPERSRVFMLAVTAPGPTHTQGRERAAGQVDAGRPTSWSATIDALAYGRAIDDSEPRFTYLDRNEPVKPRLFVISAGNIRDPIATDDHLARSDLEPVEDPAQAWNALTVGAYTEKDDMSGALPSFAGYLPIAPRGELSPASRTSVMFDRQKWPFKPDVVAEGGNFAASPDGKSADTPENLAVLTTRFQRLGEGFFTTTRDTSAATAQVAAIAAGIHAEYPKLRPETIRALIVHSAEWTPEMLQRFAADNRRAERVSLLRRYGMGVPNAERALRSATDALTLIAESNIRPYSREGSSSNGTVREMNLHELPWPNSQLEVLGDVEVRLRVTLSYFIEPNPSSRGWTGRYVYPSHGLRFATRRPEDSIESFRRRINKRAREDGQKPPTLATEKGWHFGRNQQEASGSLHTDIWTGPAVELANKGAIAVYPVAGWWKNRPVYDQSDLGVNYSLVVSIESPSVEVDLWTPVAQQIAPEVVITT